MVGKFVMTHYQIFTIHNLVGFWNDGLQYEELDGALKGRVSNTCEQILIHFVVRVVSEHQGSVNVPVC